MKKKNLASIDLSTSMFSGKSLKNNYSISNPSSNRSPSLQKAINRLKQDSRVSLIGISSISSTKIPKRRGYYEVKSSQSTYRISHPYQEPKISLDQNDHKKETIRKIFSLQAYCKSQSALQLAAQKYTVKRATTENSQIFNSPRPKLLDKFSKEIIKCKTEKDVIKQVLVKEVTKRIPKKSKEINYELDTMFKNYEKYAQLCLSPNSFVNQPVIYNGYFKIYSQSQKEKIVLDQIGEKEKSLSDESEAYMDFIEEVDEATIQRDVYHSQLRNPFLDDKITVRSMKQAGFLKRRPIDIL
ncbi:unnamed protein product (macronuclear) [Paramecium tetraurelia]|uniref:Uncharacterized protein n=1 Tax=Paramecium tetraurelia TaxID=5888 RepID=A0E4V0_PARTE|nr:uncharacterized protein GSPATT00023493001 [Paramecium tetraurelia]CAK90317.1 unnamed protein product [Paramecium tetraurelia]|eukprot:XP_001457714.1 hypothetical protein (macronuclear) [Paramecium tetraurelia strain d4-2]